MAKTKENYLDYIPRRNVNFRWRETEKGLVEVTMENRGPANWVAQKLFKRPRFSRIELDAFGSFVWKKLDGSATIYEIGQLVDREFGEKAAPLYPRLSAFIKMLHHQRFIVYQNKIGKKV